MSDIAELEIKIKSDSVIAAEKALQRLEAAGVDTASSTMKLEKAQLALLRAQDRVERGHSKLIDEMKEQAVRAAELYLGYEGIKHGIEKVVETAAEFDALKARLVGVMGSTKGAAAEFDLLRAAADETMASDEQLTNAFLDMANRGLNPSVKELKAFANIAAGTGLKLEEVSSAFVAATMGNFKGLRQLRIGVSTEGDQLAIRFRDNTTKIASDVQALQDYMVKLGETEFADASARQLETMGGELKKVGEAWESLYKVIGDSPVGPMIRDAIHMASSAIEQFANYLKSANFANSFATAKHLLNGLAGTAYDVATHLGVVWDLTVGGKSSRDALRDFNARMKGSDYASRSLANDVEMQRKADVAATRRGTIAGEVYESPKIGTMKIPTKVVPDQAAERRQQQAWAMYKTALETNAKIREKEEKEIEKDFADNESLIDSLRTPEESLALKFRNEGAILRRPSATSEGQAAQDAALVRLTQQYVKEKMIMENAKAQERGALEKDYQTEEQQLIAASERRQQIIEESVAKDLITRQKGNALLLKEDKKLERDKTSLMLQGMEATTRNAELLFGNLGEAMKNWGGEQSAGYKAMFAMQKAFAIASASVSIAESIAAASAAGGGWASAALVVEAAARGAQIMAMISSSNFSGAYDAGGFIPAGRVGLVGERGPELVQGPAQVTGRRDTVAALGTQLMIVNAPNANAAHQFARSYPNRKIVMNIVREEATTIRQIVGGRR